MIFPFSFWGAFSPKSLPNLSAWYDVSDFSSLRVDSANRVSLVGDKSGNSATNCLVLTGGANNYASTPDSAAISLTGDLDISADLRFADWTPGVNQVIVAKGTSVVPANLEYMLQVNTAGTITLFWSTGAATLSATSSVGTGFADFARGSIRATLDVDNGAAGNTVTFYTGTTYGLWTQLGTVVTQAGVTSIQNSTNALAIGAFTGGASGVMTGSNYRTQIYSGIGGTLAFDANFSLAAKLASSFTESSANAATVTINTSGATGARISGERDLYQGTVANQPIYLPYTGSKYAYLNGTSGNYLSTPDSAALDITGDIDLRCELAMVDWTPSSFTIVLGKNDTGSIRSYYLAIAATGVLNLALSQDGSTDVGATSSVSVGFADGSTNWIRSTWRSSDGRVQFFTSSNGVSWSQLGTDQTIAIASIFNSTAALNIGARANGTNGMTNGRIFRAQIYNGINGTLAFDFNAQNYSTGSTLLDASANAATITINNGATIVTAPALYFDGSNDYLKAPAFALSQPETVQFVGRATTWTSGDYLWDGNATNSGASIQTTSTPQININAGSSVAGNTGLALKTIGNLSAIFNGASSQLRVNKGVATTGNAGAANLGGITIGSNSAGTSNGNETVNEFALYSAAQSTAQLDQFANYAGNKWGFTV